MTRRPHQPAVIALQVEALASGAYRISSAHARGWAGVATTPAQLMSAVQSAFTEVAIASYARAHGEAYDLDAMTTHVPGDPLAGQQARRVRRPRNPNARRTHSPEDWSKMTDESGSRWRSPSGRLYREDTAVVQRLVAKRSQLGLPT